MQDTRAKYVSPSIDELSFNCPHCGAFAKQFWFSLHAEYLKKDQTPFRVDEESVKELKLEEIEDPDERDKRTRQFERLAAGRPFIEFVRRTVDYGLYNVALARCYNCNDVSVWIDDRLVWPLTGEAPLPNPDLPDDVRRDYDEANSILNLSPRGAAALLRLAIETLCKHLGESGKNLNDDTEGRL